MSALLSVFDTPKFEELKATDKIVLIDFWATWCPPCKVMTPIFEKLAADLDFAGVEFLQCDVDANPDVVEPFDVTSIPTFVVVKFNGDGNFNSEANIVQKIIGAIEEAEFKKALLETVAEIKTGTLQNKAE